MRNDPVRALIIAIFYFSLAGAAEPDFFEAIPIRNGDFNKGTAEWVPIYAPRGDLKAFEDEGPCLQVKTTAANYFFYNATEIPLKHRRLLVKVKAKGKGLLNFYQLLYDAGKKYVNEGGAMSIEPSFVALGPEWKEVAFALSVPEGPAAWMKPYFLFTQADSEAVLKDFRIFYDTRPGDEAAKPPPTSYISAPAKKSPPRFSGNILDPGGPLYRINLTKNGDLSRRVVLEGSADRSPAHAEVSVALRIRTNDGDIFYEIDVDPRPGYGVFEVEYPILRWNEISGPEFDRLIVPQNTGIAIPNPLAAEKEGRGSPHHFGKGIWFGTYGTTYQSMQCLLYDDTETGLMLWSQDGAGNVKDFEVSRSADSRLVASIHHYPENTGAEGTAWKSPYPVVVSPYRGGWETAAKKYRSWALRQSWCRSGGILDRVRRSELPGWLGRNPFWLVAVNENSYEMLAKYAVLFPEIEFSVFLTQWQRWPFDSGNPQYFPPKNETGYKKLLGLQQNRVHFFPYMNMVAYDNSFGRTSEDGDLVKLKTSFALPCPTPLLSPTEIASVPHYANYQAFWGTDLRKTGELKESLKKAWGGPVDEALFDKIRSDWMTLYQYEKEPLARKIREAWGKNGSVIDQIRVKNEFKYMCRADKAWQDTFLGMALQNLQGFGTDGQYLDESSVSGLFTCWSKDHGHPPGFGPSYLVGTRTFFSEIHHRAKGKVLMGEGLCETLIGAVDEAHCQYPAFYNTNAPGIPLFQTVYHGYISHLAWDLRTPALENLNDFASAFARMLHQGFKIGFAFIEPYLELLSPKQKNLAFPFAAQAAQVLLASMDTVVYGEKLASPEVIGTPWQEVTYFPESTAARAVKMARPSVEASLWRSLDGKKTKLLISNSSDKQVTVEVKSPELRPGSVLKKSGLTLTPFSIRAFDVD